MSGEPVPAYFLYGERKSDALPDALHIETIIARSALHNWRIQPHRHQSLHQFFLIEQGGGVARIDGVTHQLASGTAMLIPPLVIHDFRFEEGTRGYVASVGEAILQGLLSAEPQARAALQKPALLPGPAALGAIMRQALAEFAEAQLGRESALTAHARLIALWFIRTAAQAQAGIAATPDASIALLRRFASLAEAEFRAHRPVSAHARKLGVSAPHLSRVCREVLGHSAQSVLHERLMLEARRHLAYTSMSVSQIALALGFSDPAYFSRFFHARAGCSPSAYRAQL